MRRFLSPGLALLLASIFCSGHLEARTWYVKADGSGDVATIQGAVYAASDGDTILVAAGRYIGVDNKNVDYLEKTLVVRSESGPCQTIIDCQGEGRGFQFDNGETAAAKLQGFSIINGCIVEGDGGGISCIGSSPTIANCIFKDNWTQGNGGGICCQSNSLPTISGCILVRNQAHYGGGICCLNNSDADIVGCVMAQDSAHGGGGIYFGGADASLAQCVIVDNRAQLGAGIGMTNAAPKITNSTIVGNRATLFGGGCDCLNSSPILGVSPSDRNSIYHNTANRGGTNLRSNFPIDQAQFNFWGRTSASPEDSLSVVDGMLLSPGVKVNWWPMSVRPTAVVQNVRAPSDTLYFPEARICLNISSLSADGDSNVSVTAWPDSLPPAVYGGKPLRKWFDITTGSALGTFSADLFLGYLQSELDSSDIADESSLYCSRYTQDGWTSLPGDVDSDGNWVRCSTEQFSIWGIGGSGGPLTPVMEESSSRGAPTGYGLSQNYPNPFNASTQIWLQLPRDGHICVEIFNITGARVKTLASGEFHQGNHVVVWDGTDEGGQSVSSGLYLCRLQAGTIHQTRKIVLLR